MAPKIMESLTIKQVNKSPLQQKNELAFLQTHSCIKLRDTLLFFFCFVMTDQWSHSPHSFQRVQRCECELVYVHRRACDHMSPKCELYVAGSEELCYKEIYYETNCWDRGGSSRICVAVRGCITIKHQGCGGGGCATYFEDICISNMATPWQQLDGQLHQGLSAMLS